VPSLLKSLMFDGNSVRNLVSMLGRVVNDVVNSSGPRTGYVSSTVAVEICRKGKSVRFRHAG
jgi:hypothetical protein